MEADNTPAPVTLLQMITGYWIAKGLNVAAELGLADLLRDGPRRSDQLAAACGAHPPTLYRLLRALASVGVFAEVEEQQFALTQLAELLRSDVPGDAVVAYDFDGIRQRGRPCWRARMNRQLERSPREITSRSCPRRGSGCRHASRGGTTPLPLHWGR